MSEKVKMTNERQQQMMLRIGIGGILINREKLKGKKVVAVYADETLISKCSSELLCE